MWKSSIATTHVELPDTYLIGQTWRLVSIASRISFLPDSITFTCFTLGSIAACTFLEVIGFIIVIVILKH